MTIELKKEIEEYLLSGGYAEQMNDIWIIEDINLDDFELLNEDDFILFEWEELQDIEPIEFEELY